MHLNPGTVLLGGRYKIVLFIASGGFGCTYEAEHTLLGKRVAIKEFFPKTFCNRESDTIHITVGTQSQQPLVEKLKKKFIDEARSIAQLSHNGIVKVTDVFEENGTAYYVMDYIEGKSLGKIVDEKGPLSEHEALGYIRQVCDALTYVHSKNRLHLDIKPANIMIGENNHAILIDFGASKQYDEENGQNTSTLIGKTPGYAPIEQMGNNVSRFKPATDIYALGATLYKCLSGKTPKEANDLADGEELEPLPANVSESTKKAIKAAMEVGSKKRPQSVEEFVAILDESHPKTQAKEETVFEVPVSQRSIEEKPKEEQQTEISVPNSDPHPTPSILQNSSEEQKTTITTQTQVTPLITSDEPSHEDKPKSSKQKIYIGLASVIVIFLVCFLVFSHEKEIPISDADGLINAYEYVDLGLPSGLKWATCNVGAKKPEEFGDYFEWGEIIPESQLKESTIPGKNAKWLFENGYVDEKGNLTLNYDAAHQKMGGTWRMPTLEDIYELREHTTSQWIKRKGQSGCILKSKKNNKSIFIPASEYIGIYNSGASENSESGEYWSSSSCSSSRNDSTWSCGFSIYSDRAEPEPVSFSRYQSRTIRPVSE